MAPGDEAWGVNGHFYRKHMGDHSRWTRWFDVHREKHIKTVRPAAWTWYESLEGDKPVYLTQEYTSIRASRRYPVELVQDLLRSRRFLSSFDWCIGLALVERFEEIHLWWYQMKNPHYAWQIPSALYWIGRAEERGVTVVIHGDSALHPQPKLYGFEATTQSELFQ